MRFIFKIFRGLFTLYAAIVFALSFVITIPCYFIVFNFWNKDTAPIAAHKISRFWARLLISFYFIKIKIKGKELINPSQTYVFVANHRSMLDILVYALSCRNTFRFLSKVELTKIPLFGWMIKNLYITVNRADRNDRSRSMDAMKNSIDNNISVFLCPEGTRNATNKPLLDFHEGAFRLALKTKKPLAVLTVLNSEKLLSPLGFVELSPGTVYAEWRNPIETKEMQEEDLPLLKETVRKLMTEILTKNKKELTG